MPIRYEGTREITKRLKNTMGWSATSGDVDNFIYEDANDTFIKVAPGLPKPNDDIKSPTHLPTHSSTATRPYRISI